MIEGIAEPVIQINTNHVPLVSESSLPPAQVMKPASISLTSTNTISSILIRALWKRCSVSLKTYFRLEISNIVESSTYDAAAAAFFGECHLTLGRRSFQPCQACREWKEHCALLITLVYLLSLFFLFHKHHLSFASVSIHYSARQHTLVHAAPASIPSICILISPE